ncbi:P-loop ATPase, Sll1717 family [Pantoea agglomerans]|uniref:P-loop ATPase, Sll1717 family n=1 Tax=Enterobacter agglomerans TaxID=549 RepID=UPI0035E2712B
MVHNNGKFIKSNPLGDTTAENDNRMLSEAFVETADFRTLIESDDRTVVVGRRGTGKSALFYQLNKHWERDKNTKVLTFSPEDTQIIGFRSLLKPLSESFNLSRAATRILWKYSLLMEILSFLNSHYKLSSTVKGDLGLKFHIDRWLVVRGDILKKCRSIAAAFLSNSDPESSIGDLQYELDLSMLEDKVIKALEKSDRNVIILMDRLDEGYEPDSIGIGIIAGLTYASIELNKKTKNIRPIIFLRDNIFRALAKLDPDYSRNVEGQVIRLHWDWAQLLGLASKRMKIHFGLDIEKDQRVWDRCVAGELLGREGFKRCLQFTLYRPRDLLSLLNEAFFCAFRHNRQTAIQDDLEYAAKSISIARLEDLWKEYQKIFPSIHICTNAFKSVEPEQTVAIARRKIEAAYGSMNNEEDPKVESEYNLLKSTGILQSLYSVGFFGIKDKNSGAFSFCHDGRTPDKGFSDNDKILIHPCYWLGLNLNKNALSPDDAQEINDEYEIKVVSEGSEVRNVRIGQIVSNLNHIQLGKDGDVEFELWCLDSLRIIFAAHLMDIKHHPNGAAVQRRDIIGTNRGKSDFWGRVLNDYKSRHIVFDAKNYSDIGPNEYRQLQSYLTGLYGKIGFIINRDDSEVLFAGKELDWTKEMYHSHQVVIIKLPAKYIAKLLQKLRSPERHDVIDEQMGKLLNLYETSYLSIKSSRASKSSGKRK